MKEKKKSKMEVDQEIVKLKVNADNAKSTMEVDQEAVKGKVEMALEGSKTRMEVDQDNFPNSQEKMEVRVRKCDKS